MDRPLVSICVPLYNKGGYVAKTLQSLLAQSYTSLEVVVSDNGSTDDSAEIAREFTTIDSRVRYYRLEHTVSINANWRYCAQLAKGDFLKVHSGDDATLPVDFVEKMIEPMLRSPSLAYTVCSTFPDIRCEEPAWSAESQRSYYRSATQACREIIACDSRKDRARLLFQKMAYGNGLGSIYQFVFRRSALPYSHWRKDLSPFAWAESWPDWDFALRLMLNHRGEFVDDVCFPMLYDAYCCYVRLIVDSRYDLCNAMCRLMAGLNVLVDPELACLRRAATARELNMLVHSVANQLAGAVKLSDQVAAFDDETSARRTAGWLSNVVLAPEELSVASDGARRLRQLRMKLIEHWLKITPDRVYQDAVGAYGDCQWLLMNSGVHGFPYDVREKELVSRVVARLMVDPDGEGSWGNWLSLCLLGPVSRWPELMVSGVPDWLSRYVGFSKKRLEDRGAFSVLSHFKRFAGMIRRATKACRVVLRGMRGL